jgi:outer membrane protein assembly factor BamA
MNRAKNVLVRWEPGILLSCSCEKFGAKLRPRNFFLRFVSARLFLAAIFLALVFPSASFAQNEKPGPSNLASVEVTGSKRYASKQIVSVLAMKPGTQVTREDFQAGADTLSKTGLFSNVRYKFSTTPAGAKVTYEVSDAPTLPVVFDNCVWFTDAEINAAIKSAVNLYDGTAPESGTTLDQVGDAISKLVLRRGVRGDVVHSVGSSPITDQREIVFRVEGVELPVASVEFSDELAKTSRDLAERLTDIVGKPYSRSAMETFEFEQMRPIYLAAARLRVKFPPVTARMEGTASDPNIARVIVIAPIEPGPVYTLGEITWNGNSAIPSEALARLITLKPGGPADGMAIEAAWVRVAEAYDKIGYLDAAANAKAEFDDTAARVSYAAVIAEGPQYRMGQLVLTGLSAEGERRIRNAWRIQPGTIFDQSVYEDFLTNGIKEAFAGLPFHYDKIGRFLQKDPQAAMVDVLLDFQ